MSPCADPPFKPAKGSREHAARQGYPFRPGLVVCDPPVAGLCYLGHGSNTPTRIFHLEGSVDGPGLRTNRGALGAYLTQGLCASSSMAGSRDGALPLLPASSKPLRTSLPSLWARVACQTSERVRNWHICTAFLAEGYSLCVLLDCVVQ